MLGWMPILASIWRARTPKIEQIQVFSEHSHLTGTFWTRGGANVCSQSVRQRR
jgi:hypothetical protein